MANSTQSRKTANGSATRKPAPRSKQRKPARSNGSAIPPWTATIASVLGAGIAVGVGLYATRNQWMPKAEQWGEDLNHRFHDLRDRYGRTANNDIDEDEWSADDSLGPDHEISEARFPDAKSAA